MRQMTIDQTLPHPGGFGVKQSETHVFFFLKKRRLFVRDLRMKVLRKLKGCKSVPRVDRDKWSYA